MPFLEIIIFCVGGQCASAHKIMNSRFMLSAIFNASNHILSILSHLFWFVILSWFVFSLIDTLDQIDTRVEKLRKEALGLCEKRDVLLMSMDIIKNNELLQGLNECKLYTLPYTLYVSETVAKTWRTNESLPMFRLNFRFEQMSWKKSLVTRNASTVVWRQLIYV